MADQASSMELAKDLVHITITTWVIINLEYNSEIKIEKNKYVIFLWTPHSSYKVDIMLLEMHVRQAQALFINWL